MGVFIVTRRNHLGADTRKAEVEAEKWKKLGATVSGHSPFFFAGGITYHGATKMFEYAAREVEYAAIVKYLTPAVAVILAEVAAASMVQGAPE